MNKKIRVASDSGIVELTTSQILCLKGLVSQKLDHFRFELEYNSGSNQCAKDWLSDTFDFYDDLLYNLYILFPEDYEANNRDNG